MRSTDPRPSRRIYATTALILVIGFAFAMPLPAATVDGLAIHSSTTGTGPATVMFIHGWTCDSSSWAAQVPALATKYRSDHARFAGPWQKRPPEGREVLHGSVRSRSGSGARRGQDGQGGARRAQRGGTRHSAVRCASIRSTSRRWSPSTVRSTSAHSRHLRPARDRRR